MAIRLSMKIFRIYSDWVLGQDKYAFSSKENAIEWLKNNERVEEVLDDCDYSSVEELIERDMIELEKIELDPELTTKVWVDEVEE